MMGPDRRGAAPADNRQRPEGDHEMTTEQMIDSLWKLLEGSVGDGEALTEEIRGIRSFADAGLLTMDQGLELHMEDGSRFQLTVVQSKPRD